MRRDAENHRVQLLAAAHRVLVSDPGASIAMIAAQAGLSRRTVYNHFPDKASLLAAVKKWHEQEVTFIVARVPAHNQADPVRELSTLLNAYEQHFGTVGRGPGDSLFAAPLLAERIHDLIGRAEARLGAAGEPLPTGDQASPHTRTVTKRG
ncbi:TetR/AcrR family transcriptional regulator [Humibacter sp. BT305]|nr:TetR/AcrR family transcriptional regulator [Humibacter sp. BT305]